MFEELKKLLKQLELFAFILFISLLETGVIHLLKGLDLVDFIFCWVILYLINFMFISIVNINSNDLE